MVFLLGRLPSLASIVTAIFNLFGWFQTPVYDAIVVGGGAGGCPLVQTLIEGGLRVLLLERGKEGPDKRTKFDFDQVLTHPCAETFFSTDGVVVTTGNCLGGATSINQGVWIEETAEWVINEMGADFATTEEIEAAYSWARGHVASPSGNPASGSPTAIYVDGLMNAFESSDDFGTSAGRNLNPGQPNMDEAGIWQTYNIFDPETGERHSADYILDRDNELLDLRLDTEVKRILFDGDWGVPWTVPRGSANDDKPRARCVRLTSWESVCVKSEGRIYLAAGAFHTPELLIKSGIGPDGRRVKNPNVSKIVLVYLQLSAQRANA